MYQAVINYISNNYLELAGTVLSLFYIYFSVKENAILWVFGFFSAICIALFYFQQKIYANSLLQVYYVFISVYGLWAWLKKTDSEKSSLKISKITENKLIISLLTSVFCFIVLYFVIKKYTSSPAPFVDAFTASLCVVGTYLLARKILENWLFFIVADVVLVWLSVVQKWYLLAVLYSIYSIMGVIGYFRWKRELNSFQNTVVSCQKKTEN